MVTLKQSKPPVLYSLCISLSHASTFLYPEVPETLRNSGLMLRKHLSSHKILFGPWRICRGRLRATTHHKLLLNRTSTL